jgi:carbon-monoxide dehydrogenase medium subunit
MERTIGNVRVQVAGTLGGNLAFADPESDPATYLAALDASLLCVGPEEDHRDVPLSSFLLDAYMTALDPGVLLGRIRVPPIPEASVVVHRKVGPYPRILDTGCDYAAVGSVVARWAS